MNFKEMNATQQQKKLASSLTPCANGIQSHNKKKLFKWDAANVYPSGVFFL
jgi:hypothetical protein